MSHLFWDSIFPLAFTGPTRHSYYIILPHLLVLHAASLGVWESQCSTHAVHCCRHSELQGD